MTRTLIISAHCGPDRHRNLDPIIQRVINRFEDELKEWELMYVNQTFQLQRQGSYRRGAGQSICCAKGGCPVPRASGKDWFGT